MISGAFYALALVQVFFASAGACSVRVGHWNVYWRALDDAAGRRAIAKAVDAAAAAEPFDFFSVVEAAGSSAASSFPAWLEESKTFQADGDLNYISGKSGHETIALFYRPETWTKVYGVTGEFESGRPYALGLFKPNKPCNDSHALWVATAHLPHYPQTTTVPGQVFADALANASLSANAPIKDAPLVIVGDFNEFGECSLPPNSRCNNPWYEPTRALIEPLWSYLGNSQVADAVPFNTTTCCTKWSQREVAGGGRFEADWRHHFDHMYFSSKHISASPPSFINYSYPGTECADSACTGNKPEQKTYAQGSWHRGWQATFRFNLRDVHVVL